MVYLPTSTIKPKQELTPGFLHFEKGNSYKPSFITVTGRVQNPKYIYHPRENPNEDHQQIPIHENNQRGHYMTPTQTMHVSEVKSLKITLQICTA